MLTLNDPKVIAEIAGLHDAYEHALVTNDVASLNSAFWNSPDVVRFGVSEHLYGAEAIATYRNDSPPAFADRRIIRRTITTFGPELASVMCELSQTVGGQPRHSRQSQLWARFPDVGWKIVAAHVSHAMTLNPWDNYAERAAAAANVLLDPVCRPGVVNHLQRAAALAAPLLQFQLPTSVEIAPVFTP